MRSPAPAKQTFLSRLVILAKILLARSKVGRAPLTDVIEFRPTASRVGIACGQSDPLAQNNRDTATGIEARLAVKQFRESGDLLFALINLTRHIGT